jgi:hypothetical protein
MINIDFLLSMINDPTNFKRFFLDFPRGLSSAKIDQNRPKSAKIWSDSGRYMADIDPIVRFWLSEVVY